MTHCFFLPQMHHGRGCGKAEYTVCLAQGFTRLQLFGRLPVRLGRSLGECCGAGRRQEQNLCLPGGGVRSSVEMLEPKLIYCAESWTKARGQDGVG